MLSRLRTASKVVGVKQSGKMIREGKAAAVFIARDAEVRVTRPVLSLCGELGVEVVEVESMRVLGEAAGIEVGAAVVTITNDTV